MLVGLDRLCQQADLVFKFLFKFYVLESVLKFSLYNYGISMNCAKFYFLKNRIYAGGL
jgi:hypothetical protein